MDELAQEQAGIHVARELALLVSEAERAPTAQPKAPGTR
jgi:hypothetical protein